ncbi:Branched-chain amino acid transport system permease protein LivM (TC 3.A.1.4.1) [hydrothermal vent metagenome]|uniref:Branched-chain amino acid transport system permease protein LivM (TC 3.A.1.4.1) n=1 Tax=hydrothermal vent metagenome TaxID=652676 RepID=A0A3B0TC77_9ZZZZ
MSPASRAILAFGAVALALIGVGMGQSWSLAFAIVNLCLISAIMALGLNIQWGYAGLFNAGVMAFAALGGLAAVLVSQPPVTAAWAAGGGMLAVSAVVLAAAIVAAVAVWRRMARSWRRTAVVSAICIAGFLVSRQIFEGATGAIEAVDSAKTGYLGGLGLPIVVSWIVGGAFAAGVAWAIGHIALGLRSDYFAIATLGISEIVIALLKNEDWLARGVKNVTGLSRPVPYEADLQTSENFTAAVSWWNADRLAAIPDAEARQAALANLIIDASTMAVKLSYTALFLAVLLFILACSVRALNSPWGRMMRAIRDNEVAAGAMGKDVTFRHRQIFILGCAVIGIAGAMLTTLDGQFTPGSYNPLRFTFLIWVMVIVGGSGNNLGAVLGGFLIWFTWVEAEPLALWAVGGITQFLEPGSPLRAHLIDAAPHMRLLVMGLVLLLVLRFSPRGILPEYSRPPR